MSAKIKLKLKSFVDITRAGKYCEAKMSLPNNQVGRVKLDEPNQTLSVAGGYADLEFTIIPPTNSSMTYTALGICFAGPANDPQGKLSFDLSNLHLEGDSLRIRNLWGALGSYKAYLWIQQDDGKLGIIDPAIENEN